MLQELADALQKAQWDDEVAVIVITGAGTKAFCTGADIKEWNEDFLTKPDDFYKWMGVFIETFERLRTIGKPTIARLNGMVVGGGNELQMSCDFAIAASDVVIKHVGTSRGSVAAAGGTQWLPIIVGEPPRTRDFNARERIESKGSSFVGIDQPGRSSKKPR
jgi:enoyl-CoA hydratase/carnithine racemase